MLKILPANAGDLRDAGSIPGLGISPEGHGNPLQYSCLEKPMDIGQVHRVAKSQAQLKQLSIHTHIWAYHVLGIVWYVFYISTSFNLHSGLCAHVCSVAQLCPTLCDPPDCSLPGEGTEASRQ